MIEEMIAKRYIAALRQATVAEAFEAMSTLFEGLAAEFQNDKFYQIVMSPNVSKEQKRDLLLAAVKGAKSKEVENLLSLLVENGRIGIIPAMAVEMRKALARQKNSFTGQVYSDSQMDAQTLAGLSEGLSKKVGSTIALDFVKSDFDGVKVEVEDLGIEINFSKNRLNTQLIDHILKAI